MEGLARAGVFALLFSICWQNILVIPGIGTVARAVGLLAAFLGLMAFALSPRIRVPQPFHMWVLAFGLWAALSLSWSAQHVDAMNKLISLVQLTIALGLMWRFIVEGKHAVGALTAYVAGALVGASATLVELHAGREAYYLRYAASGFDPNDLAVALAIALPMALYLVGGSGNWIGRAVGGVFSAVGPTAILVTGSRTGLVALIAGGGLSVLGALRVRLGARVIVAGLVVLAAVGVNEFVPAESWVRLSTLSTEAMAGRFHGRERVWEAGLRAWEKTPIEGVGLGGFRAAARAQGVGGVAHNTFVSVLVELGLVGVMLFALVLLSAVKAALAMRARERELFLGIGAALFVGMNMLSWDVHKSLWFALGIVIAFRAARVGHSRNDEAIGDGSLGAS